MTWELLFHSKKEVLECLIPNKVGKRLVQERWICLIFSEDKLLAFDESCPHQGYSMLGAECKKGKIICPLHKYGFDLHTGNGHGLSLSTYPIKIEDGKYYIGFGNSQVW